MNHPYYPYSTESRHPYYPYQYGDERAGIDVFTMPSIWSYLARPPSSGPTTDWSLLAKVGFGVGVGVLAYFVYRGLRTSVSMSRSSLRGAIGGEP
jgi:hypothetical protein